MQIFKLIQKNFFWILAISCVIIVYAFSYLPYSPSNNFSRLAISFLHGRVSLPDKPDPALLKLADPYSFSENHAAQGQDHDMSYYHGKFYMYYGPTNALVLALFRIIKIPLYTDSALVQLWCILIAVVCAIFFRFFSLSSNVSWLFKIPLSKTNRIHSAYLITGYLVVTLCFPIFTCLLRPLFYEAAITCAAFFFLLGTTLLIYGISFLNSNLITSKKAELLIFFSSLAFSLCFMARYTYGPSVAFIGLVVLVIFWWQHLRKPAQFQSKTYAPLFLFFVPLFVTLVLFFLYNHARFGSYIETGFSYPLTSGNISQLDLARRHELFNFINFPSNFYMYFLAPMDVSSSFPYLREIIGANVPPNYNPPVYYYSDGSIGVLYTTPWLYLFSVLLILAGSKATMKILCRCPVQNHFKETDPLLPCLGILGIIFFIAFILQITPLLLLFSSQGRYFPDFMFQLYACLFFWCILLIRHLKQEKSYFFAGFGILLFYSSAVVSVLLAITLMFSNISFEKTYANFFANLSARVTHAQLYLLNSTQIVPIKIVSDSEERPSETASNLMNPGPNSYWASNGGLSSRIIFTFKTPAAINKIYLTARPGPLFNAFWNYYEFVGYRANKLVFDIMKAADEPWLNNSQVFFFDPQLVDQIYIIGQSPVLLWKDGKTLYKRNQVSPGFGSVNFYMPYRNLSNPTTAS